MKRDREMRILKKMIGSLFALVAVLTIAGCTATDSKTTKTTTATTTSAKVTQTASVQLKDGKNSLATKTVDIKAGESLYDVMKNNFKIEDQDGFITSIDGLAQDKEAKKYWMFSVNGKMGEKGAKDTTVKVKDKVVFTLDEMK